MRTFPLYAFSDGNITVITRGQNEEQAMSYACRDSGQFKRGVTVFPLDHLPINAAKLYDTNHRKGWLHRRPYWLEKAERKYSVDMGFAFVLNTIVSGLEFEPLMYKEN